LQLFLLIMCPCVLYLEDDNLKKTLKNFLVHASAPEADQLCLNLIFNEVCLSGLLSKTPPVVVLPMSPGNLFNVFLSLLLEQLS